MLPFEGVTLVDLSIGLEPGVESEPWPPKIKRHGHKEGAELLASRLNEIGYEDITAEDFPDGIGLGWETVEAITHAGTHMDAPYHYGPTVDNESARTIDEIPLSWCHGSAVVLDFTWMEPRNEINVEDVEDALDELDHTISKGEIVLIETGTDKLWGKPEYLTEFPGMGADATKYLVDQGAKVIGTDAYGFDKPFSEMGRRFAESGDSKELWPAHFAGREVEYCQIEKIANLDKLPRRTNVPLVAFPISIAEASAGWVRPVAMFEKS